MTKARLDKTATIEDLAQVAQRRIPKITLGYLEIGTGVLDQPVVIDGNVIRAALFTTFRSLSMRLSLNLSERQTKRR
jgi:hypothetical protein